jgi:hypothetical protein
MSNGEKGDSGVGDLLGAAEVILAFVQVMQGAHGDNKGGLTWQSDEARYPGDLARVGEAKDQTVVAVEFVSRIDFMIGLGGQKADVEPSSTIMAISGSYSRSSDELTETNRVMANTRFVVSHTTLDSDADASLSFHANALDTPEGSADDPRIRWECTGAFDPYMQSPGFFDIQYRLVFEQDQHGDIRLIHHEFPHYSAPEDGGWRGGAWIEEGKAAWPQVQVYWSNFPDLS